MENWAAERWCWSRSGCTAPRRPGSCHPPQRPLSAPHLLCGARDVRLLSLLTKRCFLSLVIPKLTGSNGNVSIATRLCFGTWREAQAAARPPGPAGVWCHLHISCNLRWVSPPRGKDSPAFGMAANQSGGAEDFFFLKRHNYEHSLKLSPKLGWASGRGSASQNRLLSSWNE